MSRSSDLGAPDVPSAYAETAACVIPLQDALIALFAGHESTADQVQRLLAEG